METTINKRNNFDNKDAEKNIFLNSFRTFLINKNDTVFEMGDASRNAEKDDWFNKNKDKDYMNFCNSKK